MFAWKIEFVRAIKNTFVEFDCNKLLHAMHLQQAGHVAHECDTESRPLQCMSNDCVNKDTNSYIHVASKE